MIYKYIYIIHVTHVQLHYMGTMQKGSLFQHVHIHYGHRIAGRKVIIGLVKCNSSETNQK